MDISRIKAGWVSVKTRSETVVDLSIAFAGDLHTHGAAQRDHMVIDDAVVNLDTLTALTEHTRSVKRVQVLRHIGLSCVDLGQQVAHIFLAVAQSADDAQSHGRRHDAKNIGGFVKDLLRFGQVIGFKWGGFGHGRRLNRRDTKFAPLHRIRL
jgi:hypothetical protein